MRLTNSAAALLQTTGHFEEAFALYVDAAEWEPAIRLIRDRAGHLVRQGRRQTLRQWIQSLPMDRFEHDPWVGYWYAVAHLGVDYRLAARALERTYEGFEAAGDWAGQVLVACRKIDISHAVVLVETDQRLWLSRLESLLDIPEPPNEEVYCEGRVMLLQACFRHRPFSRQCNEAAERLAAVLDRCDDNLYVAAAGRLMWFWLHHADRRRVQALFDESRARLTSPDVLEPTALFWHQPAIQHALAMGAFDLAARLAEETRNLADDSGCVPDILEFERLTSAILAVTHGPAEADRYLSEHVVPRLESAAYFTRLYTGLLRSLFALGEGRYEAALALGLEGLELARRAGPASMGCRYLTTMSAIAFAANGRFDEAREYARRLTDDAEEGGDGHLIAWRRQVDIYADLLEGRSASALPAIRETRWPI
ncbi:MAG: hypothetical protein IPK20_21840 [Betaproteobacteria bacterium]|nr:hypothetical protein [Betaproteobacteria bacterium]